MQWKKTPRVSGATSRVKIPFLRELALSETVFHEVGHHIQIGILKGNYKQEPVAEKWETELSVSYFVRRLWYLSPLFFLVLIIGRAFRALKRMKRQIRSG